MITSPQTWLAPAKVNLYLHILGRYETGYHSLESLFVFANKGDFLDIKTAGQFELEITGPFAAALNKQNSKHNIVTKAAALLWSAALKRDRSADHHPLLPPVKVKLDKRLPLGAGLGGGSSDGATMMLALNQLFDLGYSLKELQAMAKPLGADVPACLQRQACLVRGIGDIIRPYTLPDYWSQQDWLLVNPMVHLSTPAVFAAFAQSHKPVLLQENKQNLNANLTLSQEQDTLEFIKKGRNDLRSAACSLSNELRVLFEILGDNARLSGSGATCFIAKQDNTQICTQTIQQRYRSALQNYNHSEMKADLWMIECQFH